MASRRTIFLLASAASVSVLLLQPAQAIEPVLGSGSFDAFRTVPGRSPELVAPELEAALSKVAAAYTQQAGNIDARRAAVEAVPGVVLTGTETDAGVAVPAVAAPGAPAALPARAWATGFGYSSRTGTDRNGPGFTTSGGGATFGIDRFFEPNFLAGVTFGYTRGETRGVNVRTDSDTFSGGGYFFYVPHAGWEIDGYVGVNWLDIETQRLLTINGASVSTRGETGGLGGSAQGNVGYRFRMPVESGELYAKPFFGIAYASQGRDGYLETGANGVEGLAFTSKTFERATSNLGLIVGSIMTSNAGWTLRPELRVAWSRYLNNPSPAVQAFLGTTPLVLRDPDPGRDGALVSFELAAYQTRNFEIFAGYAGEFRENFTAHQGRGGVRLTW